MKSFLIDIVAMTIVALLVVLYLGREIEALIVFGVGLTSLRQARCLTSKQLRDNKRKLQKQQGIKVAD